MTASTEKIIFSFVLLFVAIVGARTGELGKTNDENGISNGQNKIFAGAPKYVLPYEPQNDASNYGLLEKGGGIDNGDYSLDEQNFALDSRTPHVRSGNFIRRSWGVVPDISAKVVLVAGIDDGAVFYEKNAELRWPMASITKLITAVVAREHFSTSTAITLVEHDFIAGSNSLTQKLSVGDTYKTEHLISLALITSSNEASRALSRISTEPEFVKKMNLLATEWGLHSTHFQDTTGISSANQSTAKELLRISQILNEDYGWVFYDTTASIIYVEELGSGELRQFSNINILAGRPDFLGGKTGQTPEAGGNLLSILSYGGEAYVVIVMGAEDRFGETDALIRWFRHDYFPSN